MKFKWRCSCEVSLTMARHGPALAEDMVNWRRWTADISRIHRAQGHDVMEHIDETARRKVEHDSGQRLALALVEALA